MLLQGILLTPVGQPMVNSAVRLVAAQTSPSVLGSIAALFITDEDGAYSFDCPIGRYRVQATGLLGLRDIGMITITAETTLDSINDLLMLEATVAPRDPLLAEIEAAAASALESADAAAASAASVVNYNLSTWAYAQTFRLVSATRDANEAIISATIAWPDGVAGVFTTDIASTAFPGAIDAWHATYAGNPAKLITQPAVTRDAEGAVTAQPAITIV
jgi:hypothetical protein